MRLGGYDCRLSPASKSHEAYGTLDVRERHRHRFEYNNDYRDKLEAAGLLSSGVYEEANLVEIVELPDHPWFVACQFHPEFKSRPGRAHPLFREFVHAALRRKLEREGKAGSEVDATAAASRS